MKICLEEIGSPYETVLIDLQNKPDDFLNLYSRANPIPNARAKVPVLEVVSEDESERNVVITESLVVADYVAESFPDAGLIPATSEGRATMRLFSELCDKKFVFLPETIKEANLSSVPVMEKKGVWIK